MPCETYISTYCFRTVSALEGVLRYTSYLHPCCLESTVNIVFAVSPSSCNVARVLAETSLPPARTCPDPSALPPRCSCSSVCQDALCPTPSPSARVLAEASLRPAHPCPDPS